MNTVKKELPNCSDFCVEAIRLFRMKRKEEIAPTGMLAYQRLYNLIEGRYEDREVEKTINKLIKEKKILVVVRTDVPGNQKKIIRKLPEGIGFAQSNINWPERESSECYYSVENKMVSFTRAIELKKQNKPFEWWWGINLYIAHEIPDAVRQLVDPSFVRPPPVSKEQKGSLSRFDMVCENLAFDKNDEALQIQYFDKECQRCKKEKLLRSYKCYVCTDCGYQEWD